MLRSRPAPGSGARWRLCAPAGNGATCAMGDKTEMKTCSKCLQPKEELDFYFRKCRRKGGGSDIPQSICRKCVNARTSAWDRAHPERRKRNPHYYRKRLYGLEPGDYLKMLSDQSGLCAVCCRLLDPPFVDHDHRSGVVRGLLCGPCNSGIGYLGDSAERLTRAAEYIRESALKCSATILPLPEWHHW